MTVRPVGVGSAAINNPWERRGVSPPGHWPPATHAREDGIRDESVTGVQTCTRLNSSHTLISYAVFCLKKKSTSLNSSHTLISYAVFCLKNKRESEAQSRA